MGKIDDGMTEQDWYARHYSTISVSGKPGIFQRILHTQMERHLTPAIRFPTVLEVAGNVGEHVPYVRHQYDKYLLTDIRMPPTSSNLKVVCAVADVTDLPYNTNSVDRTVASCVLHHVLDPELALQQIRRVTKVGGNITLLIPTDPSIAYRAAWAGTTGFNARRAGLKNESDLTHARSHQGNFWSLQKQTQHVFKNDRIKVSFWPLNIPLWNPNIFTVWSIRKEQN